MIIPKSRLLNPTPAPVGVVSKYRRLLIHSFISQYSFNPELIHPYAGCIAFDNKQIGMAYVHGIRCNDSDKFAVM